MAGFVFDREYLKKTLKSIYKKKFHQLSKEEETLFDETFDETFYKANSVDDVDTYQKDDEIIEIERQETIEDIAAALRIVVASYIDLLQEPYPYKINRYMPLLKDSHKKVREYFNSPLYSDIVKYADNDMFVGDLRILENTNEYKSFFMEYSQQPQSLNLHNIKERIPHQYEIDDAFFEL